MKIKEGFVVRKIANQYMAVPIGARAKEIHGMIGLNETAAFLWELLPGAENADALCEAVLAEYEVSREEAAGDIADFLVRLEELGIL
jgi:hypothetical protein